MCIYIFIYTYIHVWNCLHMFSAFEFFFWKNILSISKAEIAERNTCSCCVLEKRFESTKRERHTHTGLRPFFQWFYAWFSFPTTPTPKHYNQIQNIYIQFGKIDFFKFKCIRQHVRQNTSFFLDSSIFCCRD